MNEIVEMVFQWHQGASLKQIRRSLGFQRNTVRKYVRLAQRVGIMRGEPFPDRSELATKLKSVQDKGMVRDTPKRALIALHREWIGSVIQKPHMTAKQVWRLFQEQTGMGVGYCTMKRYLRGEFKFGSPPTTVRMEVVSGRQAQVDFGHMGTMIDPATGKLRRVWAFVMTLS